MPDSLQKNKAENFKNSIEKSNYKNIDIIPAYKNLIKKTLQVLNSETASDFILKNNLKEIKDYLKDKYDYIFLI
nr:AAA family ATPase [Spiroplasma endosymbiont of 'Nebria riversi']